MNIDDYLDSYHIEALERKLKCCYSLSEREKAYEELKQRVEHSRKMLKMIEDRCDEYNHVLYSAQETIFNEQERHVELAK